MEEIARQRQQEEEAAEAERRKQKQEAEAQREREQAKEEEERRRREQEQKEEERRRREQEQKEEEERRRREQEQKEEEERRRREQEQQEEAAKEEMAVEKRNREAFLQRYREMRTQYLEKEAEARRKAEEERLAKRMLEYKFDETMQYPSYPNYLPEVWLKQSVSDPQRYQRFIEDFFRGRVEEYEKHDWSFDIDGMTERNADSCARIYKLSEKEGEYFEPWGGKRMTPYQALASRHALLSVQRPDIKGFLAFHSLGSGKTISMAMIIDALFDTRCEIFIVSTTDNIAANNPRKILEEISLTSPRKDFRFDPQSGLSLDQHVQRLTERFAARDPPIEMSDFKDLRYGQLSMAQDFVRFSGNIGMGSKMKSTGQARGSQVNFYDGSSKRKPILRARKNFFEGGATTSTKNDLVDEHGKYRPLYSSDPKAPTVLILDEVHAILNPTRRTEQRYSQALMREMMAEPTVKCFMLTATPGDRLTETIDLLNVLVPPTLDPRQDLTKLPTRSEVRGGGTSVQHASKARGDGIIQASKDGRFLVEWTDLRKRGWYDKRDLTFSGGGEDAPPSYLNRGDYLDARGELQKPKKETLERFKRDVLARNIVISSVDFTGNVTLHPSELCSARTEDAFCVFGPESHTRVNARMSEAQFALWADEYANDVKKKYSIGGYRPRPDAKSGLPTARIDFDASSSSLAATSKEQCERPSGEDAQRGTWVDGRCVGSQVFFNSTARKRLSAADMWKFYSAGVGASIIPSRTPGAFLPGGRGAAAGLTARNPYRNDAILRDSAAKLHSLLDNILSHPDDKHLVYSSHARGLRAVANMLIAYEDEEGVKPYAQWTHCGGLGERQQELDEARAQHRRFFVLYDKNRDDKNRADTVRQNFKYRMVCSEDEGKPPSRVNELAHARWVKAFNDMERNLGSTRRVVVSGANEGRKIEYADDGAPLTEGVEIRENPPPAINVIITNKNEGLDLKGVKHIHILEPPVSAKDYLQAIGRAVRFCSFAGIPKPEWKVRVWEYFGMMPARFAKDEDEEGSSCANALQTVHEHMQKLDGAKDRRFDVCVDAERMEGVVDRAHAALGESRPYSEEEYTAVKRALRSLQTGSCDTLCSVSALDDPILRLEAQVRAYAVAVAELRRREETPERCATLRMLLEGQKSAWQQYTDAVKSVNKIWALTCALPVGVNDPKWTPDRARPEEWMTMRELARLREDSASPPSPTDEDRVEGCLTRASGSRRRGTSSAAASSSSPVACSKNRTKGKCELAAPQCEWIKAPGSKRASCKKVAVAAGGGESADEIESQTYRSLTRTASLKKRLRGLSKNPHDRKRHQSWIEWLRSMGLRWMGSADELDDEEDDDEETLSWIEERRRVMDSRREEADAEEVEEQPSQEEVEEDFTVYPRQDLCGTSVKMGRPVKNLTGKDDATAWVALKKGARVKRTSTKKKGPGATILANGVPIMIDDLVSSISRQRYSDFKDVIRALFEISSDCELLRGLHPDVECGLREMKGGAKDEILRRVRFDEWTRAAERRAISSQSIVKVSVWDGAE